MIGWVILAVGVVIPAIIEFIPWKKVAALYYPPLAFLGAWSLLHGEKSILVAALGAWGVARLVNMGYLSLQTRRDLDRYIIMDRARQDKKLR